jgi:hypothetical protein
MFRKSGSSKPPVGTLEEQDYVFCLNTPDINAAETHMNTIVASAKPDAMRGSEELSIVIFFTVSFTAA